ncbi:LexA family protein [Variovorax sp. LT1P1]|uniref:LexA family protein n=1 Tax=Variovorax sp. LT1P1 TaxID=3443730 RepID=UPI003F45F59B
MPGTPDFEDGARVGRDSNEPAPAPRRTSNAFGSPGTDSTVKRIDLNDALIKHPEATFVMRIAGDAMRADGIADGDVVLVDRAITAGNRAVVVADVAGERICRRLELVKARPGGRATGARLVAADPSLPAIEFSEDAPLEVWGVVTTVIKTLSF